MTFHLDPLAYRIRNGVTPNPETVPLTWSKSATIIRSVYRNLRSKGLSPTSARCTIARIVGAVI